jgi:hypothetical protein
MMVGSLAQALKSQGRPGCIDWVSEVHPCGTQGMRREPNEKKENDILILSLPADSARQ